MKKSAKKKGLKSSSKRSAAGGPALPDLVTENGPGARAGVESPVGHEKRGPASSTAERASAHAGVPAPCPRSRGDPQRTDAV